MSVVENEAFLSRWTNDSQAALAELDERLPEDLEIKVVQDSNAVLYLHIPEAPPEGELDDADLLAVDGGTIGIVASTAACMVLASRMLQITPHHP